MNCPYRIITRIELENRGMDAESFVDNAETLPIYTHDDDGQWQVVALSSCDSIWDTLKPVDGDRSFSTDSEIF